MTERSTSIVSPFRRVLTQCAAQVKEYGSCIAEKVPNVEHGMCEKEFLALKSCIQTQSISFYQYPWDCKKGGNMSQSQTGLASCSRSTASASGALSHAYVQYPPLRCSIPGIKGLHYDDGNKLLFASTSTQIFAWQVNQFTSACVPNAFNVVEGPVLSIKGSFDGKIMALQRSEHEVEFINLETSVVFRQQHKAESEKLLGFFWTDCPTCEIVFVNTSGLELYSLQTTTNSLKFVEAKRLNVNWFVYTHESRLVLLASGMQSKSLTGFQNDILWTKINKDIVPLDPNKILLISVTVFSAGGIIRLPKFEATMTKPEANKKPVLVAEDVFIATMYGRVYCLQVDREGMQIIIFRFYRDAVVNQGNIPIYSDKVTISVVDNVLLVHQVDAKVVLLYDIYTDSKAPISAPLPLLVRGPSGSIIVSSRNKERQLGSNSSVQMDTQVSGELNVYGDGWIFLNPDLICDNIHGLLWRINLDLEAITASSSEVPSLIAFLQRRKLDAEKAKQLSLAVMRSVLLERRPLSVVVSAIDIITLSYAHAMRLANSLPGSVESVNGNKTFNRKLSVSDMNEEDKQLKSDLESTRSSIALEQGRRTNKVKQYPNEGNEAANASVSSGPIESAPNSVGDNSQLENINSGNGNDGLDEATCSSLPGRGVDYSQRVVPEGRSAESIATSQSRPRIASTMISPDEMFKNVFAIVEEEMSVAPMYLVAVIVEYLRSAAAENLQVPPGLHVLLVQLLVHDERYVELEQFVMNTILEPSKEVALRLVEVGSHHLPTRKLGIEMLRRLSFHSDYVSLLLHDGRFLEALRYVHRNKVFSVSPAQFLETVVASKDTQKLAAALRFFQDFVPNFQETSDYARFFTILREMNTTAVSLR